MDLSKPAGSFEPSSVGADTAQSPVSTALVCPASAEGEFGRCRTVPGTGSPGRAACPAWLPSLGSGQEASASLSPALLISVNFGPIWQFRIWFGSNLIFSFVNEVRSRVGGAQAEPVPSDQLVADVHLAAVLHRD